MSIYFHPKHRLAFKPKIIIIANFSIPLCRCLSIENRPHCILYCGSWMMLMRLSSVPAAFSVCGGVLLPNRLPSMVAFSEEDTSSKTFLFVCPIHLRSGFWAVLLGLFYAFTARAFPWYYILFFPSSSSFPTTSGWISYPYVFLTFWTLPMVAQSSTTALWYYTSFFQMYGWNKIDHIYCIALILLWILAPPTWLF